MRGARVRGTRWAGHCGARCARGPRFWGPGQPWPGTYAWCFMQGSLGLGLYRWRPIAPATRPLPEAPCMWAPMVGALRTGVMRWALCPGRVLGTFRRPPRVDAATTSGPDRIPHKPSKVDPPLSRGKKDGLFFSKGGTQGPATLQMQMVEHPHKNQIFTPTTSGRAINVASTL